MVHDLTDARAVVLSSMLASRNDRRLAWAAVLASTLIFLAVVPFVTVPLLPVPGFIPVYEAALVLSDTITAVLLFGQFSIARRRALLALATGYLFTAAMAACHMLTFPGLFAPGGLLGAGTQTTAWLYVVWHLGFPVFVIAYAACGDRVVAGQPGRAPWGTMLASFASVVASAALIVLLVTHGEHALPTIIVDGHSTAALFRVVAVAWLLTLLALAVLWRQPRRSVLDLWLMVVMTAWLFDIALAALLNAGRFDLGFYAGRVYGLLAATFILGVLLLENSLLYARLVDATSELRRLSLIDPLTAIANRRAFEDALDREWRRMLRHRVPLSLLMVDVDYFKRYNDAYGHVAGDQCLRAVASVLASIAQRAGDVAARYGGEEFAILLPDTDAAEARLLAQRLCDAVRALAIPHEQSAVAPHATVSIGVASVPMRADGGAPRENPLWAAARTLVETADHALYAAKSAGRNRVADQMLALSSPRSGN